MQQNSVALENTPKGTMNNATQQGKKRENKNSSQNPSPIQLSHREDTGEWLSEAGELATGWSERLVTSLLSEENVLAMQGSSKNSASLAEEGGKPAEVVLASFDPGTWEVDAGGARVQGHPWLQSEFKASLGYGRPCLSSNRQIKESRYKGCL